MSEVVSLLKGHSDHARIREMANHIAHRLIEFENSSGMKVDSLVAVGVNTATANVCVTFDIDEFLSPVFALSRAAMVLSAESQSHYTASIINGF